MKVSLLVVEDEPALARGLADNFRDEGYEVRTLSRGDQVLPSIRDARPDLLVLDVMLPGGSGLDVLRQLRAAADPLPVLMLTAKGDVVDRVVGLELGADDYLPKPFAVQELLARVRALLRRATARRPPDGITLGGVHFDFRALTATGPEGPADLTPHDILVLRVLAEHRGEVVRRLDVVEEVCGLDSDATLRTVDNHVVALRRAIGDDPRRPRWLRTVRGEGYRLEAAVPGDRVDGVDGRLDGRGGRDG
jgi:DNA-binding response OmpR family regulator